MDQYATGGNNSIQHANTGLTIGSVLQNLRDNADRTFSYVEQAFFQRWVEDADDAALADMHAAVESGQMVFLNGAWAMHDEASPSYVVRLRLCAARAVCAGTRVMGRRDVSKPAGEACSLTGRSDLTQRPPQAPHFPPPSPAAQRRT